MIAILISGWGEGGGGGGGGGRNKKLVVLGSTWKCCGKACGVCGHVGSTRVLGIGWDYFSCIFYIVS